MAPGTAKPHHHGNLRAALIEAGLELLAKDGIEALTLRKCAALAGVSHAAPAHHFNGLISLKVAIIARGHELFTDSMAEHLARAGADPVARLNAICKGYLAFAQAHSALFQFMFQPHGEVPSDIDATTLAELGRSSAASYGMLHQACIPFEHGGDEPLNTEVMVWSLVHGYAMLFATQDSAQIPGGPVPAFADIFPQLRLRDGDGDGDGDG